MRGRCDFTRQAVRQRLFLIRNWFASLAELVAVAFYARIDRSRQPAGDLRVVAVWPARIAVRTKGEVGMTVPVRLLNTVSLRECGFFLSTQASSGDPIKRSLFEAKRPLARV